MSTLFKNIVPLLRELDDVCHLHTPVTIDRDLIPLVRKHAAIDEIKLIPVRATIVGGLHLGSKAAKRVAAIYQRCELHHGQELVTACPGCQNSRFEQAKELIHALDGDEERTPRGAAAERLLNQLLRNAWDGPQVLADGHGAIFALELLVRYRHRVSMLGGGVLGPSLRLSMAKATDNYTDLATQYGVPPQILKHAYSENYMEAMKTWRSAHDLEVGPAPFD